MSDKDSPTTPRARIKVIGTALDDGLDFKVPFKGEWLLVKVDLTGPYPVATFEEKIK